MNKPGLGTLNIIPQEVRDEIYRYLVKDVYGFEQSLIYQVDGIRGNKNVWGRIDSGRDLSGFTIFLVSKVVCAEAASIMYAESFFKYNLSQLATRTIGPAPALHRAMKIQFDFDSFTWFYVWTGVQTDMSEYDLRGTIDELTWPGSLRNILIVRVLLKENIHIDEALSTQVLKRLNAFVGFRTVIIETGPMGYPLKKNYKEVYKHLAQLMEREMNPTMGPATLSDGGHNICLEFHPFEYRQRNQIT